MAYKRVTMQDIADACGLSRNTVSKIFNDRGAVPGATRRIVLQKAQELGYYQPAGEPPQQPEARPQLKNIAVLMRQIPNDTHFGTFFLPAFAKQLSHSGYTLMMHEVAAEELRGLRLPSQLSLEQTAGILTMELFDQSYMDMLCALPLPCISVDGRAKISLSPICHDLILMENISSTIELTNHVIAAGAKRLGFIGDPNHCDSFYQRWVGFCTALGDAGLVLDKSLCIVEDDSLFYSEENWLLARLREMRTMPDALICANDFLALHVLAALKEMGIAVPDEIMLAGFDGTPQSAVVEPPLTTVQIPNNEIGRLAADLMLDRIRHPDRPFCRTYVKTTPIWRRSTSK